MCRVRKCELWFVEKIATGSSMSSCVSCLKLIERVSFTVAEPQVQGDGLDEELPDQLLSAGGPRRRAAVHPNQCLCLPAVSRVDASSGVVLARSSLTFCMKLHTSDWRERESGHGHLHVNDGQMR